jgi:hypothetical protein
MVRGERGRFQQLLDEMPLHRVRLDFSDASSRPNALQQIHSASSFAKSAIANNYISSFHANATGRME